jgi:hypothetical protein
MPEPTSIVTICGSSTDGKRSQVKGLLGLRVHAVGGGSKALLALGDEGCYDVFTTSQV